VPHALAQQIRRAGRRVGRLHLGPDFVRPDKRKEQGYTPENLVPQTAASAVSNGGAAQTFVPTEDIPGEWWKLFRSSELNALIDEAPESQP